MPRKNILLGGGVAALIVILLATFLYSTKTPNSDKPAEKIVLKAGHTTNTNEPYHLGLLEMARIVNEASHGRVEIQIFPSMQLGSEKAMIEGLRKSF